MLVSLFWRLPHSTQSISYIKVLEEYFLGDRSTFQTLSAEMKVLYQHGPFSSRRRTLNDSSIMISMNYMY